MLAGKDEATSATLTEDSNGTVAKAVGTTPGSTSYIGLAYYQANKAGITPLQLDGVDATPANITNGTYKLQANGNMYTKGAASGLSQAFIDYMLSPADPDGPHPLALLRTDQVGQRMLSDSRSGRIVGR